MLTGDAAAGGDAEPQDLAPQAMHPLLHTRIGAAIKDQGMEIAIAGVEHIGHAQAMLPAQVADRCQHLRQGGAGHHTVLEVVAGRLAADGRDCRFTPLPEPGPG